MRSTDSQSENNQIPPMRRRLKNAAWVLISQMLLIALAIAWLVHMILIASFGSINFVEQNPFILYGEIAGSGLIAVYAIVVLVIQVKRLGERRASDRRRSSDTVSNSAQSSRQRREPDLSPASTEQREKEPEKAGKV